MKPFLLIRAVAGIFMLLVIVQMPTRGAERQDRTPLAGTALVIRGGTVLTVTRGVIPNGTIVVRDGKIAAVGVSPQTPPGAQVVDATGKFVTPGIIDAHLHIAVAGSRISLVGAINEGATSVSSMTAIADVLDPTDINIYRDLAGGVTTANRRWPRQ